MSNPTIGIKDLDAGVSKAVARVEGGETLIVTKRNLSVAVVMPHAEWVLLTSPVKRAPTTGLSAWDRFEDPPPIDLVPDGSKFNYEPKGEK